MRRVLEPDKSGNFTWHCGGVVIIAYFHSADFEFSEELNIMTSAWDSYMYLYLFSDNKFQNQNLQQYLVKIELNIVYTFRKQHMLHLHFKPNQSFI